MAAPVTQPFALGEFGEVKVLLNESDYMLCCRIFQKYISPKESSLTYIIIITNTHHFIPRSVIILSTADRNSIVLTAALFAGIGAVLGACVCCRRRKKGFEVIFPVVVDAPFRQTALINVSLGPP